MTEKCNISSYKNKQAIYKNINSRFAAFPDQKSFRVPG